MADQGSEGLLSPYLRRKRFEAVDPFLAGNVLDFGCGSGGLAQKVHAHRYTGIELDKISLNKAKFRFRNHKFISDMSQVNDKFDTIVSLAVIEHVSDPSEFLLTLSTYLKDVSTSRLVVTTPHPSVGWVHSIGSFVRLFSKCASKEHNELLDRVKLENAGKEAGLMLVTYSRFLFGANQIAVYAKKVL